MNKKIQTSIIYRGKKYYDKISMNNNGQDYHRLVIAGGGNRAAVYCGALKALGKRRLKKITHFIGVSSGSLLCYLLSLGCSVADIINHEKNQPYDFCWSWLLTFPITCFNNFGFVDVDHL